MDGGRLGSSAIPVSGVDLRHHLQVQREQTAWRAVQVSDTEVPTDIRHPPPMLHKDHQQQTILWSNAAGMSGPHPVSLPGMQPNINMPPPHAMGSNMPPLMHGPNIPSISPNMPPHHNMSASPPISMPNVSQGMQGMPLAHTTQAEHMHGYHRGEIPLERNGDLRMMGDGGGGGGGGGVVGHGDGGMGEASHMEPPMKVKKDKATKEKTKKVKKLPKEKAKPAASSEQDPNKPPAEKKVSKAKVCACERCGKGFVSWQNMKIHYTNVHKEDCVEKQYNTKCPYEGCGKSFFHRKTMLKHLEADHNVKTEQEHYEFENMDGFLDWKENEEAENHVYFVKQRGLRFHKGWYDQHYYCQRDGSARAHVKKGQPERKTNRRAKKGVTKTGIACPAKMSVKYQKGEKKVSVIYTKTHSHPISITDTQFHPIPKRTIAQLSEQFAKGVPVKQVHREIKHVVNQFLNPPEKEKNDEPEKENSEEAKNEGDEPTTPDENKRKLRESPRRHHPPPMETEVSPPVTPALIRVLNKRQLHAIKVQADTARIRDACQKLVSVFERSARVRKKLLDRATNQVEDLLEECISVALAPSTPLKRGKGRGSSKSQKSGKAKRRKVQLRDVIQEAAQQENIAGDIQEVELEMEVEHIQETLVEDRDDTLEEPEPEPVPEESTSIKEDHEEDVPHDQQTIEIPLTNLAEGRSQLQEALPEEESCVVTLLAQMEGQTAIDYYKDKDPNVQTVVTEVHTFDSGDTESTQNRSSYQVLMEQSSEIENQQ